MVVGSPRLRTPVLAASVSDPRLPACVHGWDRLRRPIWLFDPVSCRGVYANAPALELWGAGSLEELLQRDFSQLSPAVRSRTERLALVTADGSVVSERWSFYPRGQPVTVQAMISSLELENGRTVLLFEAASVEIEQGELRAVEALRHTSSPITLFGPSGVPIFANPAAFAAYGDHCSFIDRFQDRSRGEAAFAAVLQGEVMAELREVRTLAGERSHFIDVRRVLDPATGQASVLLSERDVTAQVDAEWARHRAEERAEVAEAKQRFLANISHELRTPLNSVMGFATLLASSGLDAAQQGHLSRITQSGEALLRTINDVIDLSELDDGRLQLDCAPFDPAERLYAALLAIEPAAIAKGLELQLDLPEGAQPWVGGDARRFDTVVTHYLANAVKFTERGVVVAALTARPAENGEIELEVCVADTGPGIDPALQGRLFRRFGQGDDGASRRTGGAGLGLAVSRELVALMGGEVGVESEPGAGARFWLRLRLPVAEASAGAPEELIDDRALVILYADDNESNRLLVKTLLESQGHSCETVNDGAEAVRAVRARPYDLVLMDIQMPVQDGVSATLDIRADPGPQSGLPILAVTANTLSDQCEAYQAAGLDDCIAKPVKVTDLFDKVSYWASARPERLPVERLKASTG